MAIIAAAHPVRVKDMLAYMRPITREATSAEVQAGSSTTQVFHRNRSGLDMRWDQLDPSLHIAYMSAQAVTPAVPCTTCSEVDHSAADCVLASLIPATKPVFAPRWGTFPHDWSRGLSVRLFR